MIVAQLVNSTTSRFIPISAPAILAGQAINRANTQYRSDQGGMLGIVQSDLPAFVVGPQPNSIQYNAPRTVNVATNGRLAIRVATGQAGGLTAGGQFACLNGEAYQQAALGFPLATTLNGDLLFIDEKIVGADGVTYLLVFFN